MAYLVSFITIGILWIEHHGMISAVRGINRRFLERMLIFLLFISIIPWPTALAADYADQAMPEARAVAVLYAATMLMDGCWRFDMGMESPGGSSGTGNCCSLAGPASRAGARRALLGGLVYLIAIAWACVRLKAKTPWRPKKVSTWQHLGAGSPA